MWEMVPIGTWPKNRDRLGHTAIFVNFLVAPLKTAGINKKSNISSHNFDFAPIFLPF